MAKAALRLDVPVAELAPQAGHDRFDGIGVMTIACAIEMVGDLSRRNTPALLVAEEVEKAVFELRKLDVPSAERRRHPRGIDRQLSGDDERGRMSRSAERRGGTELVSSFRSRWWRFHKKKK